MGRMGVRAVADGVQYIRVVHVVVVPPTPFHDCSPFGRSAHIEIRILYSGAQVSGSRGLDISSLDFSPHI